MSDTRVMTLTDFLLARYDEDEAVARRVRTEQLETRVTRAEFGPDADSGLCEVEVSGEPAIMVTTGRTLAEVAAKRRIVTEFPNRNVLKYLAAVYVDHPNYDPAWASVGADIG